MAPDVFTRDGADAAANRDDDDREHREGDGPEEDAGPDLDEVAAKLLAALKQQPQAYTLPAELDERLEVARETVFLGLERLRTQGYVVDFHPYFGFRLVDIPETLSESEILENLNTRLVARRVVVYQSTGATSDIAWDLVEKFATEGKPTPETEGLVVLAEEQVRARGRFGRKWLSPREQGLWMSVVLTPGPQPDFAVHCEAIGALALATTLRESVHIAAEIKWPNDVVVSGRKIGAIRLSAQTTLPGTYVLNLMLNVGQSAADFPESLRSRATSIRVESGETPNRNRLARTLLFYLDSLYVTLKRRKFKPIVRTWRDYSAVLGREVLVIEREAELRGQATALDPVQGLTVLAEDGTSRTVPGDDATSVRVLH